MKKITIILFFFLVIGFASVSSILVVNGFFGIAEADFEVRFTKAIIDGNDLSDTAISSDGRVLSFNTSLLKDINSFSSLNFEVTNTSTNYDALISTNCTFNGVNKDFYEIFQNFPKTVKAGQIANGSIRITLKKPVVNDVSDEFSCKLIVDAKEKVYDISSSEYSFNNNSIYSWSYEPLLASNYTRVLDVLDELGVTQIYQYFESSNITNEDIKLIISRLRDENIDVYSLSGREDYYREYESLKQRIDFIVNYNSSVEENLQIKGAVFDVELYLDPLYKDDIVESLNIYTQNIERIYNYAKQFDLSITNVIPYWFDETYLNGDKFSLDEKAAIATSLEKLFKNSDRISIMNYYKTSMLDHIRYELELANRVGTEIESIAEFHRPTGPDDIPETITFWGEEEPFLSLYNKWSELRDFDKKIKYSYHDLNNILELKSTYKKINIEYVDENNEIITSLIDLFLEFKDGSIMKLGKSLDFRISKSDTKRFYTAGYEILAMDIIDLGDNEEKLRLKLRANSKNVLEIYSKLNGSSIKSGKIVMRDSLTGEEMESEITPDGYALIRRVNSNTLYEVFYVDELGQKISLDSAEARGDVGDKVSIVNESGQLFIPYNFKSSNYIAPTFYFSN